MGQYLFHLGLRHMAVPPVLISPQGPLPCVSALSSPLQVAWILWFKQYTLYSLGGLDVECWQGTREGSCPAS